MEKTYDPKSIETKRYKNWENEHYFAPQKDATNPYCIMIPPPNVTGTLHMGHGFQHTIMDILSRYHRMLGDKTLWQPGVDHAGIATQMVVERQLLAENKTRHDLGREDFVERIWEWKHESGNTISEQMRRLGSSVDWTRQRFTMDEGFSDSVIHAFVELYDQGLIYRGKRLVNWDPKLHTAISDLEVENVESDGHLWHIRYPLVDSDECLVVATTRPETMLGDMAVAVHPDDERYTHLVGKMIRLPLTDREIPIIADDYVDSTFGTGCVKITPAHDFNDYAMGERHNLDKLNILTDDAAINENAPEKYQGLDRFDARKQMIDDLTAQDLIEKIDDHKLTIPYGDRSGVVLEPYLTDQWYVHMAPLANKALKAVDDGRVKFVPGNWKNTYDQWLENIQDWCISRQLWWGHRIPAWYDNDGKVYVGKSEEAVRKSYGLADDLELKQDDDVLDTWFSSSLWPFATLGWPQDTVALSRYYPTQTLVTGFDIIFFWVARMIMMGLHFMDEVPFTEVYITGLIRDPHGKKMSKSKGNVIDPIDLIDGIDLESLIEKRTQGLMQPKMAPKIEKATRTEFPDGILPFGTDAVRFTFCALASTGRDIRFDVNRLEGYRNFCNKLWNASRFVLMNTEDKDTGIDNTDMTLSLADKWILARLQKTIDTAHKHFKEYRFDLLAHCLYEFAWNEFCDWYLELVKPVLYNEESSEAALCGTRHTLANVLESILRLLHPIMPFVTEEIWQRVSPLTGNAGNTIMLQAYPTVNDALIDDSIEAEFAWLQQVIVNIRTVRSEMTIPPSKDINAIFHKTNKNEESWLASSESYLKKLAKLESITVTNGQADIPQSATTLVGSMEIHIPMAGLIDVEAESARLQKEIDKIQKNISQFEGKLNNENYVKKAPAPVVEQERVRLQDALTARGKLEEQLVSIKQMS